MTTRNLVPRGDSEGKLGISSKRWEEINSVTLKVTNLENTSGSLLLKKGPGIGDIALDSAQLKIALDSTFLTSLGFDADGTLPIFTSTSKILADDSIVAAINKLDTAAGLVASPEDITFSQLHDDAIVTSTETLEASKTSNTTLATPKAIVDWVEAQNYTTNTGDITGVTASTGLTGGGDSGDVTLSLTDTTVTAATYGSVAAIPTFTVDDQGRLTAASNNLLNGISITAFSDVTDAGSGIIITDAERTKLSEATASNTVSKLVLRDGSGNFSAGTITAALTGNATSATSAAKWTTARTLTLSGDLSGSVSIDGSAGFALNATVNNNAIDLANTTGDYVASLTAGAGFADFSGGEGVTETIAVDGVLKDLDTLGEASGDGEFIVATGAGAFAYESGATVRTSLGLGTGDSPTFVGLTSTNNLLIDNQKELRLSELDANGSEYVAIRSPAALGDSYTLTLPINDGSENFVLITDGSGVLSWSAVTGASGSADSFSIVSVSGQANLEAESALDTLTVASGNGISITTAALTDTLTITASEISNDEIAGNAAIADSKLATISTANKISLTALDIDGGSDIGAPLVDADLIIIDDGASEVNRKSALSRVATYINNHSAITSLSNLSSVGVADSTLTAAGSFEVDQNLTVTGTLTVNGDQFKVDGTTVQLDDNLIELGLVSNSAPASEITKDLGLLLHDHNGTSASIHSLYWDNSDTKFRLESGVTEALGILSDGTAAGLVVGALEASSLSLTTDLAVAQGGTGASTLTDHGVLIGSGADPVAALSVGINGQLLIGSTGADPVFDDLTAGDGLSSTAGAGSLSIEVDLKDNGGLVIESGEIAVKLDASSITGTLAVIDGGTGATSLDNIVGGSNGGITVTNGEDTVIGGNVTLSLNLSNLASASVDVSTDSITIIDANDSNGAKQESIKDVITAVAGEGLSATNGVLAIDLSEFSDAQIASGDKFLMLDSDNANEQLESIDDIATFMAGNGLAASSGVLAVDLHESTEATADVATDSIIFIDANDSNSTKRETIGDLIALTAGDALSATNGVLAVSPGTGLEIDSDTIRIAAAAAGNGLAGGGGSALALDLNELTAAIVDVSNDSIAIIDANDSNATRKETISDFITSIAGDGLEDSSGVLSVKVDNSTLEIDTDTISVKDDGITLAKLAPMTNATIVVVGAQANSTTPVEITVLDEDDMASDSATALATQQSVKAFISSQATRFGGIFSSSEKINDNKDANDVYDVEMDSNPIIRGKIGPFAYDLGSFNNSFPFESDIIFYGENITSASDRHFKVNTDGSLEFEGAALATP